MWWSGTSASRNLARKVLAAAPGSRISRPTTCLLSSQEHNGDRQQRKANSKKAPRGENIGRPPNSKRQPRVMVPTSTTTKMVDLAGARKGMDSILARLDQLQRLPPSFSSVDYVFKIEEEELRMELFRDAREFFQSLRNSVQQGQLRPSGKHGKELSKFLELVLLVYSQTPPRTNTSTASSSMYNECQQVLDALSEWNLDFRNAHHDYAILLANREERWTQARNLFLRQIDPDAGYNPVEISVSNPMGLYAIARFAQEEGSAVVEQVYDAALRMSMVSPNDQEKYVLAAGTALGHAGEWESAMEYLKISYSASQLGQPLVASVMNACLLCERHDKALQVFEENKPGIAGEWQWGGGRDRIDPLCRDLAMRAMVAKDGMSDSAMDFFRQTQEEGVAISLEALRGVVGACEQDGRWADAVSVLATILDRYKDENWVTSGSAMVISDWGSEHVSQKSGNASSDAWLAGISGILASVVRSCNKSSNFGMAMLCFRLVDLQIPSAKHGLEDHFDAQAVDGTTTLEKSLLSVFTRMSYTDELVSATMVSLCGLHCYSPAGKLFERASNSQFRGDGELSNLRPIYEYAMSELVKHEPMLIGNSWESAHKHIHRLTAAVQRVRDREHVLGEEDRDIIDGALATTMSACTSADQPETSLFLVTWIEKALLGRSRQSSSGTLMPNFLGIETLPETEFYGFRKDALMAEAISAFRWSHKTAEAIDVFESLLNSRSGELGRWKLSCGAGLSALHSVGRIDDALNIFYSLDDSARTPDAYTLSATGLAKEKRWKDVDGIYRRALKYGCLSEELGLLAMDSVILSDANNKLRILRSIVGDVAKCSGSNPLNWMESRYWHLKKALPSGYVRLLLWWNDPDTAHLDELELVLGEFHQQKAAGFKVKNEAVRLIVKNAMSYHEGFVPEERRKLFRVPRTSIDWITLLQSVLDETKDSSLHHDVHFVDDVAKAFRQLQCNLDCVKYVADALSRGVRVKQTTINTALGAAQDDDSVFLADDLQMMLLEKEA